MSVMPRESLNTYGEICYYIVNKQARLSQSVFPFSFFASTTSHVKLSIAKLIPTGSCGLTIAPADYFSKLGGASWIADWTDISFLRNHSLLS
jgi:hypothetical protein